MCSEAIVRRNGKPDQYLSGAGELAEAVGLKHSYKLPVTAEMGDQYMPSFCECLCHIDFRKLAEVTNLHYIAPRWDGMHSGEHILSDGAS